VLSSKGELYIFGTGAFGKYNSPCPLSTSSMGNIVDFDLKNTFGIALDDNGMLWGWGNNSHGELAVGDNEVRSVATPIIVMK